MVTIKRNVPLAPLTTFRIGGKADYFVDATGAFELAEAIECAGEHKLPTYIFSGGSNVLFSDKGFAGMVIRMTDGGLQVSGEKILCGAGMPLFDVVRAARDAGLSGIERLAGVPGSFGGAIRGNAGAFGTEIGSVISSIKGYVRDTGMVREYSQKECGFAYRTSLFKKSPDLIILSAEIKLTLGDKEELGRVIEDTVRKREAKHPQAAFCAGSFFMNPVVKDEKLRREFEKDTGMAPKDDKLPAGWLIDHVGLRGKKIGGVLVSDRHPNYLVNTGNATAEDVITLASLIKTRVRDELSVRLQEEVQFVGF
ncbi:MAG: UDP-N-acetylenolpyruvoylglucosamine reductase [Candidatus Magasanikbacteria bacterium GW2011_GWA2_50_22]|uniref:UDP-N-acetylenolpyruvoylglucosamine reductase n=1 Tax=Candidatus Magasanikbacteria bacterium GW2011_GWA2_50_22 TaxID=1619043 RepID=A0A0G1WDQ9_9BACT|nr:MAG: UDP-N-acetylenolpyruvoylglucosamine reductase [Candidatus Magasanikbacteria bacterium GW2011_GWA2_50_22]